MNYMRGTGLKNVKDIYHKIRSNMMESSISHISTKGRKLSGGWQTFFLHKARICKQYIKDIQ